MKRLTILILLFIMFFTFDTYALKSNDANLIGRTTCEKIELAHAKESGEIISVSCFNDYNSAKNKMYEMEDNDLIILERKNNETKVIDAKYALVYLDRGDVLTYLYSSKDLKNNITYMNNSANYGATDGALIEINYSNKAAKIRLGGVTGWVKENEYKVIPVNWVKSYSYYKIDANNIYHYYAKNIENTGYSQSSRALGPRPNFEIENKNYKSFDGIYFYNSFIDLIDDYRSNTHDKSVNKDNPYYNYYLFLPHRSKTNYEIDDLESYIRNVLNFKGSTYGKVYVKGFSTIYGAAEYFMYGEKMYGANALMVFSLSRNESANGQSSIAINKNNIFGHNAVDGAAYSSATGYLDIRSSIYTHGYGYVNYGYARFADSRYNGSHFGNKHTGMNVMYASDVYWGEKAASYYYSFDKDNGMADYNYYQLIISKTKDINIRTSPSTNSTTISTVKKAGIPFILLEEVEGTNVNGNNIWYKIQSDSNIDNDGKLIGSNSSTWPQYNWDGALYVHSSYFEKINDAKDEANKYHKPNNVNKDINASTIQTYASKTAYNPLVAKLSNDTDFYYSSTLANKKGTLKKDSYVVILEEIKENNEIKYLVITDYGTNQKAWIDGKNVLIVNKDLLSVKIDKSNSYIDVYDNIGGTSVLKVYTGNYLPIIDKKVVENNTYLKVQYKNMDNISYGYVDGSIENISYTLNYINTVPSINAFDQNVLIGTSFNPMNNIKGEDVEDGDITDKIIVTSNNVDTTKKGVYTVSYSLTDSYGDTTTKEIKVTVVTLEEKSALFMFDNLKHQDANKFIFSGFMGIKGMDNINVTSELIFVNELTKEEHVYPLDKWNDYPYEMSSLDDEKTYNYSGGWFKSIVDLSNLPVGNYTVYVKVVNDKYTAKTLFTNIAYVDMTRRAKGDGKEFLIDVDYTTLNSPLIFSVRNNLISLDVPKTMDPMYNFFNEINLEDNKLHIKGTSHNYGVSLGINDSLDRKIIFENQETFEIIERDLGSIIDGDYPISLAVSDNLDKTRAWYNNTISLEGLNKGTYTVYFKNTVNNVAFYGEVIDVAYTDFSKINNAKYELKRNDNLRLRLELIVK